MAKAEGLLDFINPRFDADSPDTRFNKRRFCEFLQVELTPDIRNIYCYADAMGIDAKYQFAFNCAPATASRIVARLRLAPDSISTYSGGLQTNFKWWDSADVARLPSFGRVADNQKRHQYFWYDATQHKAYYIDFDL